ncbi:MAG TPA: VanZ family protein [Polyangiaceae bacterium]|nr:VanZ family protein [Polyangiaceae bacterium]
MTAPSESRPSGAPATLSERGSFLNDVLPALVWTAICFIFGGIPNPGPSVPLDFPVDKLEHAAAFGVLQILALRALRYELPGSLPRGMPWIAALVSTLVGGALELYQLTVPNRSAELMDLVSDAVGAVLATLLMLRLDSRRRSAERG